MPSDALASARRLTRLYIIALSAVGLLSVAAQVLVQLALDQQSSDARVINIAGRQRMLSQRLTKAALALEIATDGAERQRRAAELTRVTSLWEHAHVALQHGDAADGLPGKNSPEVTGMFAAIESFHQSMLHDAKDILAAVAADGSLKGDPAMLAPAIAEILAAEPSFLGGMDKIVFRYDDEARARVERLKHIELVLLALTLSVLFVEGLFVFRPATREIRETIGKLVTAKAHLNHTVEALRTLAGVGPTE